MAARQSNLTNEQLKEVRERAIEQLADINLHRRITLPPNPEAGRPHPVKVAFADTGARPTGCDDVPEPPVLLIVPGLMGSRLHAALFCELGKIYGVRLICIDKPGFGGSDCVPIEQKMQLWLEAVPFVLDHLKIKYVSLVCHSAGSVLCANVLLHLRHLLDPVQPYVAFLAPWVSPRHGSSKGMLVTSTLPACAIRQWPSVIKFMDKIGFPFLKAISHLLHCLDPRRPRLRYKLSNVGPTDNDEVSVNIDDRYDDLYDDLYDEAYREQMICLAFEYARAESFMGLGIEAEFCVKGCQSKLWGAWKDYDNLVKVLASNEAASNEGEKLQVDVYHSAKDHMVGKRGQRWFDHCWREEIVGEHIKYKSTVISNTDHDNIVDDDTYVLDTILEKIAVVADTTQTQDQMKKRSKRSERSQCLKG